MPDSACQVVDRVAELISAGLGRRALSPRRRQRFETTHRELAIGAAGLDPYLGHSRDPRLGKTIDPPRVWWKPFGPHSKSSFTHLRRRQYTIMEHHVTARASQTSQCSTAGNPLPGPW